MQTGACMHRRKQVNTGHKEVTATAIFKSTRRQTLHLLVSGNEMISEEQRASVTGMLVVTSHHTTKRQAQWPSAREDWNDVGYS